MMFGFCPVERTDVPVDSERRCLTDQSVTIPPSWGKRGMAWTGAGWDGDKGRPEGYMYRPRFVDTPQPTPVTSGPRPCPHCGVTFSPTKVTGTPQRYCSSICKNRAGNARQRAREKAAS